jgi:hypothetical protein
VFQINVVRLQRLRGPQGMPNVRQQVEMYRSAGLVGESSFSR